MKLATTPAIFPDPYAWWCSEHYRHYDVTYAGNEVLDRRLLGQHTDLSAVQLLTAIHLWLAGGSTPQVASFTAALVDQQAADLIMPQTVALAVLARELLLTAQLNDRQRGAARQLVQSFEEWSDMHAAFNVTAIARIPEFQRRMDERAEDFVRVVQ